MERRLTMAARWTRTDAFAHFGAQGKNPRWSWSARSADGKTVVLTMWQDEFRAVDGVVTYATRSREDIDWGGRLGNLERIENLKWARANCGSLVRAVIAIAKDTTARVRSIERCFPHPKLVMKITDLNEDTGEFRAVSVVEQTK
jgi:hypothetical protein